MDLLKQHYDANDSIRNISEWLLAYSESFRETGNDNFADKLYFISVELKKCHDDIEESMSKMIIERYNHSQETSAMMLKACLAGIEIERKQN